MFRSPARLASLLLALHLVTAASAQDGERAFLVVDPANAESMYVANYYAAARDIPAPNFVYMEPGATNYPEFAAVNIEAFLGTLANNGVEEQVDFVIIPPGGTFFVSAPGLISDTCFPVNRFSIAAGYTLARVKDKILIGMTSSTVNNFNKNASGAKGFDSTVAYRFGDVSTHFAAERYHIGAMLGYTGTNGNTLQEVLDMIDRSVAADDTHPGGTFYFMETSDFTRSSPRHGFYPNAVTQLANAGGVGMHLLADLPLGNHDCLGIMTGLANPNIDGADLTLLPGSFADHLTSYAGTFSNNSQTKMSRWIAKGASGTAGTVEEPCNYAGKFPHGRIHVVYFKGVALGEAWFRSMGFKPFQNLFLGDPLTRPWATWPAVDVPNPPQGPVSGTVQIVPVASAGHPTAAGLEVIELLVDGVIVASVPDGGTFDLDTTTLADGWHELRVLATDDHITRSTGRWSGELAVDNFGRSLTLGANATSGDLGTLFDFAYTAGGGTVDEVRLLHHGRVVAASTAASGTLSVYGQNLGAGPVVVQAEALFTDGRVARSTREALDIDYMSPAPSGTPPVAFSYEKRVLDTSAFVLELPAAFDDDPSGATYTVVSSPAQATLLSGGQPAYRIYQPDLGASGTDVLTFTVDTPSGSSALATVEIVYEDGDPCDSVTTYCVTSPNSAGPGAEIGWSGSVSVAANDLTLTASGCPPGENGIFFYGSGQAQNPVGNGFICIGGNFFRHSAIQVDATGFATYDVDNQSPPHPAGQIVVGSTWNWQFWFRDPGVGAGYDFSDGLEATFCP